ncbi:unnamed protein product [Lota lota]
MLTLWATGCLNCWTLSTVLHKAEPDTPPVHASRAGRQRQRHGGLAVPNTPESALDKGLMFLQQQLKQNRRKTASLD